MIWVIVGNIGSGKTLLLTYFSYLFSLDGYTIYSNYQLDKIPYQNINNVKDFLKIDTPKNFFALDEFWLTADARRSSSFMNLVGSRHILQSRKIKAHVCITTQTIIQLDKRIRSITEYVFEPKIVKWIDGKPFILQVKFHRLGDNNIINTIYVPLILEDICIPDSYNTFEIVDEFDTGKLNEIENLVENYYDHDFKTKTEFKSYIYVKELQKGKEWNDKMIDKVVDYIKILKNED